MKAEITVANGDELVARNEGTLCGIFITAGNIALAMCWGYGRTIGYISLISFGFDRRITPNYGMNNELLYFYSS